MVIKNGAYILLDDSFSQNFRIIWLDFGVSNDGRAKHFG